MSITNKDEKRISICHVQITPIHAMPRVWREAESAHRAGMKVTVIGEGDNTVYNDITFIGFPKSDDRINRFFVRSRAMVKEAIKTGAEIIQVHSPEFLLYARYIKRKGRKLIFDSHEFYAVQIETKEYLPSALRKIISRIYRLFEKFACKNVDCILYPCTMNGQNYFEKVCAKTEKIENYSSEVSFVIDSKKKGNNIIYAGALTYERGISSLVEAVTKIDCKLVLCGNFSSEEYKSRILAKSEDIEYLGTISRDELFEQYNRCRIGTCLLLPVGQYNKIDNFSTKMYEYMQCGLPVVMSDFPFWKRMNEKYNFGINVDPYDVEAIVSAIKYLISHPKEAKRMGENGRVAVESVFNWEIESEKLLEVYRNI